MREMNDSGIDWIGEIPLNWKCERTKNFFSNHKEIAGSNADKYERLALTLNGVIKRSKEDSTGLQPEAFEGYQILHRGELVFKLIDLANVSTSRVGYSPFTGIVSPAYIVLNPRENIEARYSEYYFLSMWHREIFNHLGDDGVRSSLNAGDLLNIPMTIPPLSEQSRIADFLDRKCAEIDSVTEKTKQTIVEYKALKQSIIAEAVTKGIRGDRPMKDSGIEWVGEIPEEWDVIRAKFIANSIYKGNGITKEDVVIDGDTPCVRYGEIYSRYNNSFCNCVTRTNIDKINSPQYCCNGDILFAGTGELVEEIGKNVVYLGNEVILVGGDIIIMNHNKEPRFLNYALGSSYAQTQKSASKTKLKVVHISGSEIGNIVTFIPNMEEQVEISDYLDTKCAEIDRLIAKKEQYVTELESFKKSLIYEYVTGKKQVE